MGRILRYILCLFSAILIVINIYIQKTYAQDNYIDIYYNDKNEMDISDGVTQITDRLLTSKGIVDVNILRFELDNKNIKFENVSNEKESGKKTTLSNLVKQKENVLGAVNGDFFEMYLSPSFELGVSMNDGKIERFSTGEYYNYYSNSLASLMLDKNNKPLIDYIKLPATFSNKKDTLYLSYVNKLGDKEGTVLLSGKYFKSSKDMDNRNPNTYKIVVKNDRIIQIVEPEITIDIAEDEYVIFLPVNFERIQNFEVNDKVEYKIESNVLDDKVMTIGGASRILLDGAIVQDGYIISSRTSRSFVGYNADYLFFGTVGGRTSTNVGVTHSELGQILKRYDIRNAMHLDGGGSTEIISKEEYGSNVKIINDVSSERAIVNSLVATNTSKSSKIVGVKIKFESEKVVKDSRNSFKVFGYNVNHDEIEIKPKEVTVECEGAKINKDELTITFPKEGRYEVNVSYKNFEDTVMIDVYDALTEVIILPDPINLEIGSEKELKIYALTEEKYKIQIDPKDCDYIINPPNLAKVVDGKVIGVNEGAGTIGVSFNELEAYSLLTVGYENVMLENFSYNTLEAVSYPENVKSKVENVAGKLSIEYGFNKSEESQAAYAKFTNKEVIPKGASKIRLELKGDKSNNILKVKLVDDKDSVYNITICENINFKTTKTVEAELPTDYSGNLRVERIYVVSLSSIKNYTSEIKVDSLECVIPYDGSDIKVEASVKREAKTKNLEINKLKNEQLVFINNAKTKTLLSNYIDNEIGKRINEYEDINLVLARNTNNLKGQNGYGTFEKKEYDDVTVISMSTIAGSAYSKDPYQYVRLENMLKEIDSNNIIITIDADLINGAFPTDKAMLDYVLDKYYKERRVNFFVVCFSGSTAFEKVSNGIKYIRIPDKLENALSKHILVFESHDKILSYNFVCLADVLNKKEEEKVNEE